MNYPLKSSLNRLPPAGVKALTTRAQAVTKQQAFRLTGKV